MATLCNMGYATIDEKHYEACMPVLYKKLKRKAAKQAAQMGIRRNGARREKLAPPTRRPWTFSSKRIKNEE